MKDYETLIAFIGNFSPIFGIAYIVYVGIAFNWTLFLVIAAVLFNLIWLKEFGEKNLSKNCDKEHYEVLSVKDIGSDVIAYFLSYSVALPSIFFLDPLKGLIILAIILILTYTLFYGAKIMFFNPFLVAMGYYEIEITTKNKDQIYLISKRKPKVGESITVYMLNDFVYYLDLVYQGPNTSE